MHSAFLRKAGQLARGEEREYEGKDKGEEWARVESEGEKDRSRDCLTSPIRSHFLTPSQTLGKITVEKRRKIVCLFFLAFVCLFDNVFAAALVFE